MQTLKFEDILAVYVPVLVNSAVIDGFCMTKYGKPLTIMEGYNGKNPPKSEMCPFLAFTGFVKQEGDEIDEFTYHLSLMAVVSNGNKTLIGNVVKYEGSRESRELSQLIYECLCEASKNYPIAHANTTIDSFTFIPQFPGYLEITLKVPVCIGGEIIF
jgi:hypothetical protein